MKKILVIGGSSSNESINKVFAQFTLSQLKSVKGIVLDLNDYEMPIYSIDKEKRSGIPPKAKEFIKHIESSDGIIISLAEHNGSYTTAIKNVIDWCSRERKDFWQEKPMFLLSTSPGKRGGQGVLEQAKTYFPRLGANIITSYSLPQFNTSIVDGKMTDHDFRDSFDHALTQYQRSLELGS